MPQSTISVDALRHMLLDPRFPDEAIRPYLIQDPVTSKAFDPDIRLDPERVVGPEAEGAVLLSSLNRTSRWRRQQRYRDRLARGWPQLRIVSEGDSWFQYPFLLKDVIDWLEEDHAIFCLAGAGDLVGDMLQQDEVIHALDLERANILLLSGGGNDLLGEGRLAEHLHQHRPGADATSHVKTTFDAFLSSILSLYGDFIRLVRRRFPTVGVVIHGYDRAIPRGGKWLGRPMHAKGIADPTLQRKIVGILIDRFNDGLAELSQSIDGVHYIDCRGVVATWYDELHPTDEGYGRVAELFRTAIAQL